MPRSRTLYLVRHAIAADRGPAWPDDAKRPLTHKGIARFREVVGGLRALDVKVDLVVTSPLLRAAQTAQLLVDGLAPAPTLNIAVALSPGVPPARVAEALVAFPRSRTLAIVGHEPGLGELAAWLIGAGAPLPFKKGGVCRIDVAAASWRGAGHLQWFATPRMLRGVK